LIATLAARHERPADQNAALERQTEKSMNAQMGVWLDHRKAIVVAITDNGEETGLVISNVERQLRRAGDSPLKGSYETRRVPADDSRQRAFTGHLNIYYDAVIASIREAESILIFGPGEAKGELKARLEKSKLAQRIAAIETADKMTDRQIAAKVRAYFGEKKNGQEGGRDSHRGSNKLTHNRAEASFTFKGSGHHDND
jgi:hypothetical protein